MKKRSKLLALSCFLSLMLLAGCGNNAETAASGSQKSDNVPNASVTPMAATEMGIVTAVDGNKITYTVNSQMGGMAPNGQGGAQPSMPDGQGGMDPNTQGGSQPAGNQPSMDPNTQGGSQPAGNQPGGMDPSGQGGAQPSMPDGQGGFDPNSQSGMTGETKTLTVSDTSILYKNENNVEVSASLSDITAGAMLQITYGDSSEITKIVIGSGSIPGGNNPSGNNPAGNIPDGTAPAGNIPDGTAPNGNGEPSSSTIS